MLYGIKKTLEKEGQFVVARNSATPEMGDQFQTLQKELSKNKNAV